MYHTKWRKLINYIYLNLCTPIFVCIPFKWSKNAPPLFNPFISNYMYIQFYFCTLSRHFVGKYHYMYNQNTIHSTEHHQSIISDHRRRFTEIHGDTQAFVKLLRSGGVLIICSIVQTAGSTCNQYIIKRNNAWFCPYLQCTDEMHVILHLDCEPMTLWWHCTRVV